MSAVTAEASAAVPVPRGSVDDSVVTMPELWVPEASQWLSSSAGRMAADGFSWMQAVHRVAGSGLYSGPAQASEFARVIPPEFDRALGIRTVQRDEDAPAYTRAASGIAEAVRELMAKMPSVLAVPPARISAVGR
ncbi:hypothetical protein AB0A60_32570 [Streptomyces sp. NPDC046275]|uniref:hypothetical protein n=1 Tax=Streptomyces sp. NPDC046275 TaxID=3157201 RepID=UPI0033C0E4DD